MSFKLTFLACFCAIALSGCATAPKHYEFDPVCTFDCDFDTVWSAVVEYFAISSLPIATIEKDSGLIVTSWMNASKGTGSENKIYCDCGGAGLNIPQWTRGKFNVFVKELQGGKVDLRITCVYQQEREFMESYSTVDCASTGYLEKNIHDYVLAKVSGEGIPDVPSYRPATSD